MNEASEPPAIAVEVGNVMSVPGGFRVEFRARKTGGSTGAQVEIEGILSGGGADEISRVVFDYVPGHSVRQGGLFFTRDPRTGNLSLRARGYCGFRSKPVAAIEIGRRLGVQHIL